MFRIPFLPDWLADIKSYGVMMMIAFLTGIWMATRRAMRSQADPDVVLNMGLIALVTGVAGARIMFVWHYWQDRFANQANPILAIFDIRSGGLEFWGGPILTIPALIIYLRYFAKASTRWYLDITAPSLAWGLAITRIGCFLNGCCWGSLCVSGDASHPHAALPWAVRFPYGSPAMVQQYKFGQLTLPKELIYVMNNGESFPLPREYIEAARADGGRSYNRLEAAVNAARAALAVGQTAGSAPGIDPASQKRQQELQAALRAMREFETGTAVGIVEKQCHDYGITVEELARLAAFYASRPVHPTQLYETASGLLICWLLTLVFYYRSRHGVVLPWFLILYSVSRWLIEAIRQDNPLDVGGLTISQAISIGTFLAGVIWLVVIYKALPPVSPRVRKYIPPEDQAPLARPVT